VLARWSAEIGTGFTSIFAVAPISDTGKGALHILQAIDIFDINSCEPRSTHGRARHRETRFNAPPS
jgi:hypothetical protein